MKLFVRRAGDWWPPLLGSTLMASIWLLGARRELWYSERFVQAITALPWRTMLTTLRFENNPPLWYAVARIWQHGMGTSEVASHTLSLLVVVAALCALWRLARAWTDRSTAILAVALFSVASFIMDQAGEYRMYGFVMLWSALLLDHARMIIERPTTLRWTAFTVFSAAAFYTHYTLLPALAFVWIWIWAERRDVRPRLFLWLGLVGVVSFPWAWYSLVPILSDVSTNLGVQQASAPWWSLVLLPIHTFVQPLFAEPRWLFVVRVISSVAIVAALLGVVRGYVRNIIPRRMVRILVLYVVCITACSSLMRLTLDKYAAAAVPAIVLSIAIGLDSLRRSLRWWVLCSMVIMTGSAIVSVWAAQMPKTTYREALDVVARNEAPDDRLLVVPFNDDIAARPYYRGRLALNGFFPPKDPGMATMTDNVRNNFKNLITTVSVDRLSVYVDDAPRVWMLYDIPVAAGYWNGDVIDMWFLSHGYHKTVFTDLFHNTAPLLVEYTRKN